MIKMLKDFGLVIVKKCINFLPALIFYILYKTIPAIPFVRISPCAFILVIAFIISGILLTFKLKIGGIIGVFAAIFAIVGDWLYTGNFNISTLIISILVSVFFIFTIFETESR